MFYPLSLLEVFLIVTFALGLVVAIWKIYKP